MLICNLIEEMYTQVRKEQFGLCSNYDTFFSMILEEYRHNLGCTGVIWCYTPITCSSTTTVCAITTSQTVTPASCTLTITQI